MSSQLALPMNASLIENVNMNEMYILLHYIIDLANLEE